LGQFRDYPWYWACSCCFNYWRNWRY